NPTTTDPNVPVTPSPSPVTPIPPTIPGPSNGNNGNVPNIPPEGLVALTVHRRRERRRVVEEQNEPNSELDDAPRTAFRHESFMVLVKDAAEGFYAPGTGPAPAGGPPSRSPSPLGMPMAGTGNPATTVMAGSALLRQNSGHSQNSGRSLSGRISPSTPPPPLAHVGGRY
ncbi:hypothetical protein BGW38_000357, partial [Lunasporangiospora selenospora]